MLNFKGGTTGVPDMTSFFFSNIQFIQRSVSSSLVNKQTGCPRKSVLTWITFLSLEIESWLNDQSSVH